MVKVETEKKELLRRFKLTKEQLQEQCSDDHLNDISKFGRRRSREARETLCDTHAHAICGWGNTVIANHLYYG